MGVPGTIINNGPVELVSVCWSMGGHNVSFTYVHVQLILLGSRILHDKYLLNLGSIFYYSNDSSLKPSTAVYVIIICLVLSISWVFLYNLSLLYRVLLQQFNHQL